MIKKIECVDSICIIGNDPADMVAVSLVDPLQTSFSNIAFFFRYSAHCLHGSFSVHDSHG